MAKTTRIESCRRILNQEKGLTLLELLLTGVILAIIVLTILQTFLSGLRNAVATSNATIATKLCQESLEIIKRMNSGSITIGSFPPDISSTLPPCSYGTVSVNNNYGTRTVQVKGIIDQDSNGTSTSYLEIIVRVDWEESERTRSRLLATYRR